MIMKPNEEPSGWAFSCSKKVDDISRHESKHDPKYDPKHGTKPKPEGGDKPGMVQIPGSKPVPGEMKT
jgi:flagellar basal body rod protein FlgC